MAERPQAPAGRAEHALGTAGDQDIVKGPRASDDDLFVRVGTTEDPIEADLLTTAIADAGIPVAARAQKDHLLDPLVNPNVPFWALMVPDQHAAQARTIVQQQRAELRAEEPDLAEAAEAEERTTEPLP